MSVFMRLIKHQDVSLQRQNDPQILKRIREKIGDNLFNDFYQHSINGLFFNKSLQIYSASESDKLNIEHVNNYLIEAFGHIYENIYSFACDLFGNQFAYDLNGKIILFNIETGERECVATNFKEWIDTLYKDLDYLTGCLLANEWIKHHGDFDMGYRFCPKIPFILGGDYVVKNMYIKEFFLNLKYNSDIAKQVYDLPDGTKFELKIE